MQVCLFHRIVFRKRNQLPLAFMSLGINTHTHIISNLSVLQVALPVIAYICALCTSFKSELRAGLFFLPSSVSRCTFVWYLEAGTGINRFLFNSRTVCLYGINQCSDLGHLMYSLSLKLPFYKLYSVYCLTLWLRAICV